MTLQQLIDIMTPNSKIRIQDGRRVVIYTGQAIKIPDKLILTCKLENVEAIDNVISVIIIENPN